MSSFDFSQFSYNNPGLDGVFSKSVRFATVAEFSAFVKQYQFARVPGKIAGDATVLINKATRDYWKVEAGPDGFVVIHRLNDDADNSVSF